MISVKAISISVDYFCLISRWFAVQVRAGAIVYIIHNEINMETMVQTIIEGYDELLKAKKIKMFIIFVI